MHDDAILAKRHVDVRGAAHDVALAEARVQPLEVRHAVEERHDRRVAAHRGRDRVHRRIEVVGLAGEEHDVVAAAEVAGDHRLHRELHVADRAFDAQPLARDLLAPFRPHEKGHVRSRLREPAAEISADAAGAEDEDSHGAWHHF